MDVRQPAHDGNNASRSVDQDMTVKETAGDSGGSSALLGPVIAVGIVFAVAGALTGLASSDNPPDAAARRREIASMSRAERERLQRNDRHFRNASEADRQRLRHLGAVVSRDPALEQTLRNYTAWLDGLTPWQRQEVASSEDDDVKVAVIRRILAEQKRQREEYEREQQRLVELFNKHRNRSIPKSSSRPENREWERLKCSEVATALRPLEESLPAALRPAEDPGMADRDTADRNLEVLAAALKHYSSRPDFHDEPIPRSVLTAVVAELPDGRRKRFLESRLDESWMPRFLTVMFVRAASENWWDEARRERRMPRSRAEIEALVAKLSPKSQDAFTRLEARSPKKAFEANWHLLRAYHDLWMEETEAEFNRRFAELREIYKKLDFRGPFPPSSYGNRGDRGDRDNGDRRGFDRGGSDRGRDRHDGWDRHRGDHDDHDDRNDRDKPQPPQTPDEPARAE